MLIFSSTFVTELPELCLQHLPGSSLERPALASLVCAQNVTESSLRAGLIDSGLLHLFVVSGSHLIFLLWVLSALRVPPWMRAGLLVAYVALTGAQAPALRALLATTVPWLLRRLGGALRTDQKVLFAGVLTLALVPDWFASLSLQLSWACALALGLAPGAGVLASCVVIHVLLWPFVAGWSPHPPIAILCNAVLGPLLGGLLFPVALATMVTELAVKPFDFLMAALRSVLAGIPPAPPADGVPLLAIAQGWALLIGFHAGAHLHFLRKARRG